MIRLLWLLALLAACHRDGRGQERTPAVDPPPVAQGSGGAVPPPMPAPPGSAELVGVPGEIAAKLQLVEVAHGLARPVAFVVAPGDRRKRWFVVEQHAGRIRIIENGKLAPKPFLTVGGISDGNEQGLLGLAFHPGYATNGRLFVNYTDDDNGATHIVEYKVSTDPDVVDPASRKELIKIGQPFSNHNGGHLAFGPDGKLYTGMGDGGDAGDPEGNGQNPKALLGKILRFDVDAANIEPERVHLGSRNPWRFSFDAKTGDLYIGDVGQNLWENVFAVAATDKTRNNFGWNVLEGNHCFRTRECAREGFTLPVADYSHEEGCSVTGGFVYRGKALPQLDGRYFYADYCTGLLRSLIWNHGYTREHWDWKAAIDREGILAQVSSFGVDADGELYIVELTGSIYKLAAKP